MTLAWPGKEHVRVHLGLQANGMSARPRCQCSAFGHLTLHPNPSLHHAAAVQQFQEPLLPAPGAMFAKAERWRKPQPSGPGPGAYEAPYGAGFTFSRRWTRDTCRQRHQRQRRVAAPAALPGPTLLVARSPTPYEETVIGKGGLAQVILGRFGGRKVAVKVVSDEKKNEELRKEFDILQIVAGHPHVVMDFDETSARSAIMELLGPSLLRMISFPGSVAPFAVQDVATLLNALKHIASASHIATSPRATFAAGWGWGGRWC